MSVVLMHFWELATRAPPGCLTPSKYGTNGCIPAVVNKAVGSFSGTSEAEGIIVCSLLLKKSKNLLRNSFEVIEPFYQKIRKNSILAATTKNPPIGRFHEFFR